MKKNMIYFINSSSENYFPNESGTLNIDWLFWRHGFKQDFVLFCKFMVGLTSS